MNTKPTTARLALVLGTLSALGPLSIDMYLPSLPTIARDLGATESAMQNSLMTFFIGLALGQLLYGPLSDRVGRKPVIYWCLGFFVLCSIACALATSATMLIFLRLLQGLAGSIGVVIGFAVVRDLYTGVQATRLLSLIILVLGVSPILAPVIGSWIAAAASWRFVFGFVAAYGALCMLLVSKMLPETRSPELRASTQMSQSLKIYGRLLRDGRFVSMVLIGGLAQGALFAYLAGSAFVFINIYGLSPVQYSLVFSVNAVALIGGAQCNAWLMQRLGPARLILIATSLQAVGAVLLCSLTLLGVRSLPVLCALLFVCVACQAFINTPASVLAMEPHGQIAGVAAALRGSLQFGCGAAASAVVSAFANGTSLPMIATITVGALGALVLSTISLRRPALPATVRVDKA